MVNLKLRVKRPSLRINGLDRYISTAVECGIPKQYFELLCKYGIVLQARQLIASANALACDTSGGPTEIGYGGARGGGKSHWGLAQVAMDCLRFQGLTCLVLRKVGKANRENFEELRSKVLNAVPTHYQRQEGVLQFMNGSKIILGHFQNESDIDAYLGLEYDVILVEEATTLSGVKYKAIRTCCRSSKIGWRPRIYTTANPGGVGHAWYKSLFVAPFRIGKEVTTRFIPATVDDNQCVNPEYRRTLDALTGWMLRAWRFGDWDLAAGQFFTNWRPDVDGKPYHVIEPFALPKHWKKWGGMDYGWTHFTTFYLFAKDDDGMVYVAGEYAARKTQPERIGGDVVSLLGRQSISSRNHFRVASGHDFFNKADEGPTYADRYKKVGLTLHRAHIDRVNGAAEILARLGDLDAVDLDGKAQPIETRLRVFNTCTRLIECIPSLEHNPNRPEDVLKYDVDEDGLGGDDSYDGFRYGLMEDWRPPATVTSIMPSFKVGGVGMLGRVIPASTNHRDLANDPGALV